MKSAYIIQSYDKIYRSQRKSKVKVWFFGLIFSMILFLLLPWTQNIKIRGSVTSLSQENRPQEINSPIPGKINKWWVKEGDFVKKGDTILQLSEIKEEYLDPELVNRTKEQLEAKKGSIENYASKAEASSLQIKALYQVKQLKKDQLKNKIQQTNSKLLAEKAELVAAENELNLSKDQFERQQKMYNEGLVSQTQLQQRNQAWQAALAKKISLENKLAQTRQELLNLTIEQNSIEQEYTEKINKAESDRFQSLSQIATGQGELAKLKNQVSNYIIRNGMYIMLAPQDGQIVQAKKAGLGEIIKEGECITFIVPTKIDHAVEMFVRPVDLPLISIGQKVRFMFDGFPAIVFSGWPESSYGTFGGRIVAYESNISPNGYFRVLVAEDTGDKKWPAELKMGSGAQGIALLKDVPIWYELWRNINGFPPDYYKTKEFEKSETSNKANPKN